MYTTSSASPKIDLKIVIVGDANAGKTSLYDRYTKAKFDSAYKVTIGADFCFKTIQWEGHEITLQLWDTCGTDRTRNQTKMFYRGAHGAIVLYDRTAAAATEKAESVFNNIMEWKQDVVTKADPLDEPHIPILLVANKCDLQTEDPKVNGISEYQYAHDNGFCGFYAVSAKTSENVEKAFMAIIKQAVEVWKKQNPAGAQAISTSRVLLQTTPTSKGTAGGCDC